VPAPGFFKLICGLIARLDDAFTKGEEHLVGLLGPSDSASPFFDFDITDYYEKQMGTGLKRRFLSFVELRNPDEISDIKIETNRLESRLKKEFRSESRIINIDPGYLTASALIMGTAKDFSHRIPLQKGIYAHLELLFRKTEIITLDWTYPDFKNKGYQKFFWEVRKKYLNQLRERNGI